MTVTGVLTRSTWAPCADGATVELYRISGGGHAWPGGERMSALLDEPSTSLDATRVSWAFFATHSKRNLLHGFQTEPDPLE